MNEINTNPNKSRSVSPLAVVISALVWLFLFSLPFFLVEKDSVSGTIIFPWAKIALSNSLIMACMFVYYFNHFLLIPQLLLKEPRWLYFVCLNIILILLTGQLLYAAISGMMQCDFFQESMKPGWANFAMGYITDPPKGHTLPPPPPHAGPIPQKTFLSIDLLFFLRDHLLLAICVVVCVLVRFSRRWRDAEHARRETELNLLKHQINPHFMLNTLNNIYALIGFDPEKAQNAVMDLAKMLRYLLYDTNENFVSMEKELQFLRNYIELMKLRVAPSLNLTVEVLVQNPQTMRIAPMLAGALVENAFKHGISGSQDDFIKIKSFDDENNIMLEVINSYYPKENNEKNNSGVGLATLERRLELLYKKNYQFSAKPMADGKSFRAFLSVPKYIKN